MWNNKMLSLPHSCFHHSHYAWSLSLSLSLCSPWFKWPPFPCHECLQGRLEEEFQRIVYFCSIYIAISVVECPIVLSFISFKVCISTWICYVKAIIDILLLQKRKRMWTFIVLSNRYSGFRNECLEAVSNRGFDIESTVGETDCLRLSHFSSLSRPISVLETSAWRPLLIFRSLLVATFLTECHQKNCT